MWGWRKKGRKDREGRNQVGTEGMGEQKWIRKERREGEMKRRMKRWREEDGFCNAGKMRRRDRREE